jgi:hypothetical protein
MVNGATKLSKLDIIKAFHQLMMDKESRHLTTITTHIGLLRYKRLHMGISCASEIFTEVIRVMLADLAGQVNMTDDILVFGKSDAEHQRNLMAVLKRLEENGVTLNIKKCKFYCKELTFFGLRFSESGISPTEDRCRALREATAPENAKDLHSFLCTALYSSRFMKDLHVILEPLRALTRAGSTWRWTEVEQQAFMQLKEAISTKCMAYFNTEWNTEVHVDAGPAGVGGVLVQHDPKEADVKNKIGSIICFASRTLSETERRYSQCEKEALAAVWGCERFWLYLFGKPFKLVTDNRAVQLIFNSTTSKPPARI